MTPADLTQLRTLETEYAAANDAYISAPKHVEALLNKRTSVRTIFFTELLTALPELLSAAEALHTLAGMRERIEAAIKPNHVTICAVTRGKLLADLLALLPHATTEQG